MLKNKTTYLLIISFATILLSCQKATINSTDKPMQEIKISEKDFNNRTPITIATEKGNEQVYAVIIFTDDPISLKENGIIVQSESKNFVTALIKKSDIHTINRLKTIKSIEFPIENYHN